MLCATLAAPPMRFSSRSNWTMGTGASGEMRVTRPIRNWSSITSPTTRTRARETVPPGRGRARGSVSPAKRAGLTAGRSGRRRTGSVSITRNSIRNSESPKLCSNSPAREHRRRSPRAPPAARNRCAARRELAPQVRWPRRRGTRSRWPAPAGRARRQSASARCAGAGSPWLDGVRVADTARRARSHHVRADARQRMRLDHRRGPRAASRRDRGWSGRAGRRSNRSGWRCVPARAGRTARRRPAGSRAAGSPCRRSSSATASTTPTHALRVNVSAMATASAGITIAAHAPWRDVEQQPRDGGADHEHQQTRVGHVVPERALRPLAEMVVVEACRTGRCPRIALAAPTVMMTLKTVSARFAARELVDGRHEQEQDQLLGVDEARARDPARRRPTPASSAA